MYSPLLVLTTDPHDDRDALESARLALDEVRVVYRFTEAISADEVDELSGILSEDERARARRFYFARDRRDFTAAHALLRRTLSSYEDRAPAAWEFEAPNHGKPAIANADSRGALSFNISHTHGLVACAIARGTAVGVDVEWTDRVTSGRDIASRYFSAAECRGLNTCADASEYSQRFIELWTLKESYLKGIGTGLSHPLGNFSFDFQENAGLAFAAPPDAGTDWQFLLAAPAHNYRLAVAVRRTDVTPRYRIVLQNADATDRAPSRILRASIV